MAFNTSTYEPISPDVTAEEIGKWTRESAARPMAWADV
jgi:hypothetical protein